MSDLNRKEDSPIMKKRREWEALQAEEELRFDPNIETISQCKAEIKSIDEMLDRLDLNAY